MKADKLNKKQLIELLGNTIAERDKFQSKIKELIEVIKECDDYLKGNKLNYIGNGSILHTMMKKVLKTNKK